MTENKIDYENDSPEVIEHKKFYQKICAHKKPYFFIYNYPSLKKEYDEYIFNVENKAQSIFAMSFDDLQSKENRNEDEEKFVGWANRKNPIDMSPSVMNKICWTIEKEFNELYEQHSDKFNCSMIKSNYQYSMQNFYAINSLYKWYKSKMNEIGKKYNSEYYTDMEEHFENKEQLINYFIEQCEIVCPNKKELCNILIDICYNGRSDKEIVWIVCGETIIDNLLENNNYNLYYPVKVATDSEFECGGHQFVMKKMKIQGGDEE